jgi:hypothetical protein
MLYKIGHDLPAMVRYRHHSVIHYYFYNGIPRPYITWHPNTKSGQFVQNYISYHFLFAECEVPVTVRYE